MTIAIATHSIIDRPSTWTAALTQPPFFDKDSYQKLLDKICGKTQQGEPVMLLVWGGSEYVEQEVQTGLVSEREWIQVPRFAFESKNPDMWGQKIPIRRWFILENTDAGQLEAMGGKNHGDLVVKERGFYTPYICIADHSKCPKDCKAEEFKCFGDYKHPGNEELSFLTEATYQLLSKKQDHRKKVDLELAAQILKDETPDPEEIQAHNEEENRRFTKEWINTHKLRFDIGRNNGSDSSSI